MIDAKSFCDAAKASGFSLYTGVPCSYVKPFINFVIDAPDLTYIGATNEGDAVAIATGAELGGKRAIVMMQNSGLGNAVSPLTSLNAVFRIPVLMIVTLRGEPGGPADEPQHELMGAITTRMLDVMNVAWDVFPAGGERDRAGPREGRRAHGRDRPPLLSRDEEGQRREPQAHDQAGRAARGSRRVGRGDPAHRRGQQASVP